MKCQHVSALLSVLVCWVSIRTSDSSTPVCWLLTLPPPCAWTLLLTFQISGCPPPPSCKKLANTTTTPMYFVRVAGVSGCPTLHAQSLGFQMTPSCKTWKAGWSFQVSNFLGSNFPGFQLRVFGLPTGRVSGSSPLVQKVGKPGSFSKLDCWCEITFFRRCTRRATWHFYLKH